MAPETLRGHILSHQITQENARFFILITGPENMRQSLTHGGENISRMGSHFREGEGDGIAILGAVFLKPVGADEDGYIACYQPSFACFGGGA